MPDENPSFPELNRLIHEPARLAILTVLSACESADFTFLQSATGLTKGNLSVQITRLEEARLVHVEKRIRRKKTLTTISLTSRGRWDIKQYWQTIDTIRTRAVPSASRTVRLRTPAIVEQLRWRSPSGTRSC
jgi:DNA-binding transcriptional ArsR family regulator